jgi:hypothetical protein
MTGDCRASERGTTGPDALIIGVVREIHELVPWAEQLTDELDRFFREYLSG